MPKRSADGKSHFHCMSQTYACTVVFVVCVYNDSEMECVYLGSHLHRKENKLEMHVCVCASVNEETRVSVSRKEGICAALNELEMCVRRILSKRHLFCKLRHSTKLFLTQIFSFSV